MDDAYTAQLRNINGDKIWGKQFQKLNFRIVLEFKEKITKVVQRVPI